MAEIYKATLSGVGGFEKVLVIKKILPGYANNKSFIKMLIDEAKLASVLHHPNIVQIYELGEINGQYFIAMEYVHGKDLLKILSKCSKIRKRIPIKIVLFIISEVAKALNYAHNATDLHGKPLGIIHRDVSPSNIIISYDGNVKIMDFGVAKAKIQTGNKTRVGVLKGKIGYMSPEQVMGKKLDHRSDIFSLGIILYEAIVLKRLFLGKTDLETLLNIRDVRIDEKLSKHADEIPPKIEMIIRKALAKNPDERFQSANEMYEAINDYLFENKIKVSQANVSEFLSEIFEKEEPVIQEEFLAEEDSEEGIDIINQKTDVQKRAKLQRTSQFNIHTAKFQIKGPNGEIFGPISFENLVKMMKAGAVSEEELISVNEGSWRESKHLSILRSLQELSTQASEAPPLYEGEFDKLTLPRLFFNIVKNKINGRLQLKYQKKNKNIYIKNQRIISVTSNNKNELLGIFLLKRGIITRRQLEEAIEYSKTKNIRLGGALIALKYLKGSELSFLIEILSEEKIHEVFTWYRGEYKFFENDLPEEEVILTSLKITKVIANGVRKTFRIGDFKRYFKDIMKKKLDFVRRPKIALSDLNINAKEQRLLKYVTPYYPLAKVIENNITSQDLLIFLRVVFLCIESGILTIVR